MSASGTWLAVAWALLVAGCDRAAASSSGPPAQRFAPPPSAATFWLSETGLYRDIARKQLAADVIAFEPAFALWTDGASKRRWLRLPAGARIDTSDMDHWAFPEGTVLWKEFSLEGRRIETRVIARTGLDGGDVWLGAFLWNDDESDARFVPAGARNARGSSHDVPASSQCSACHNGEPGRVLGFSAVQQPHVAPAILTHPRREPFVPPGDARAAAALGYLHANCGHCHSPNGSARPDTDMELRLSATAAALEDTALYRSTVGRPVQSFRDDGVHTRVVPGASHESALAVRMGQREPRVQMPPLGTERVDAEGLARVRAWIDSL